MALQIWLPLNGNMKNYGLLKGTTIVQNGGEPVYEDGKLAKALVGNGSKNWRISGVTLTANASITWWSKTTVNAKMPWVLESTASAILNFFESSIYTLNTGDSNNNPFQTTANANINVLHDGAWHHFAVTFGGSQALLYIDGAYAGKAKTFRNPTCTNSMIKLAGDYNRAHSYDWNGSLNDFRVYNNTLSAEDVKEIYENKRYHFSAQWRKNNLVTFGDVSGVGPLTNQKGYNLTTSGNSLYFNGTNSYVEFSGLTLTSGGTVSMWVNLPAKPTVQRVMYCDPSSKMVVGFLAGGTILTAANSANKPSYQSTGMTWGALNHVVAVYGNDRQPSAFYVNGIVPATGANSNWTNSGEIASVGRRIGSGNADHLIGCVNDVRVFEKQLTADEVKALYAEGPNNCDIETRFPAMDFKVASGATWMRVLHHNNPGGQMFTSSNCTNNEEVDRFSKLYLFNDETLFQRGDGTYEFLVEEKLESGSTLWTGRWTQTSNPARSGQADGFVRIFPPSNYQYLTVGIGHSGSAWFNRSNGNWWCATGCYTFHNGGIPGYSGVVKSGFQDFYVRVDGTNFINNL